MNRLITTFDEVPPFFHRPKSMCCLRFTSLATMVFPLKRVPPKSFVRSRSEKPKLSRCETRKDSAVHVSLSSSSLVKQPGTRRPQPSRVEGFRHPYRDEWTPTDLRRLLCTQQGEEHQWRVRSPWSVTRRRRAQWSGYRPPRPGLSTPIVNKSSHSGPSKIIQRFQRITGRWRQRSEATR